MPTSRTTNILCLVVGVVLTLSTIVAFGSHSLVLRIVDILAVLFALRVIFIDREPQFSAPKSGVLRLAKLVSHTA